MKVADIKKAILFEEGSCRNPAAAADFLEKTVREECADVLLIPVSSLGEETAPALGIRLKTGVAAHCIEIREAADGELAFMVPAFGGKVVGEIFIPGAEPGKPAIATLRPEALQKLDRSIFPEIITVSGDDAEKVKHTECAAGVEQEGFTVTGYTPGENTAEALDKAEIVFCGGFGIGGSENWRKIEELAAGEGGAAGCTRPVVDAEWGPDEYSMIGTSGRSIKPKVYVGFGISGAAHHLCGIQNAETIISINSDKNADMMAASDYVCVQDAGAILDELLKLQKTKGKAKA